jgi:hypothetical protein
VASISAGSQQGDAVVSVIPYQRLFDTGMQYYTIGRYSVLAGVNPVAGNLLHHAIEMFLKGALAVNAASSPSEVEDEIKEHKGSQHGLDYLWPEFKKTFRSKKLANYDHVIAELKTFEDIRQPARRISQGLTGKISVKRNLLAEESWGRPEPIYELSLQDIDELAGIIFAAAHVNPKYFTSGLKAARHYLAEGNAMAV